MRIDVVTIFPDYLAPLELSLAGKARERGLLDVHVHDLRHWTQDRHRTVDDTPYGGGAGMVMKPEPWGEALDEVLPDGATLVVPTPAGVPFTQGLARELAAHDRLVFACGRYEGIDQRVVDDAAGRADVREVSIGDYVLNGGEVAALAITEAVVRLLPGFMGNAESLLEESHEDGLLEYPVYTKPASWRGREVPAVLLSGDHAAVAAWRHAESVRRTAERRPDLAHRSTVLDDVAVRAVEPGDAGELFVLQRACWVQEALANDTLDLAPLRETLADVRAWSETWQVWVVRQHGRLIAAVRARAEGSTWHVGRLMVAPDQAGQGMGSWLLAYAEEQAPAVSTQVALFTGRHSLRNIALYERAGFTLTPAPDGEGAPDSVRLIKPLGQPLVPLRRDAGQPRSALATSSAPADAQLTERKASA